ncbi:MAG: hypothetical protein LBI05_02405 [Planctomycetaceae bacterium]|nr:hypothetical protein [Planctomycetaceae bacterium]
MPRRDEEKRISFLRTLSVEDLANRRITEFSSEPEKLMIHQARDAMKEKNDERWMRRYKKKAAVDTVKTQMGGVGRRAQNEVFGREGGLTGGMIGSWIVGGTLAGGSIIGIASRGKFGQIGRAAGKFRAGTRIKIEDLRKFYKQGIVTDKHGDKVSKLIRKHQNGQAKDFDYDQLDWLHKRYQGRADNLFPRTSAGGNPNVPKAIPANSPAALPAKTKRKLSAEERQILKEHRQKIRGSRQETADGGAQAAAEIPSPVDPKVLTGDALTKLRTARGGGASLRIERGNTEAFEKLARDIADVSEQYADQKQQYEVMEALSRKAAQQNTKGNPHKLDDFFNELYGRVIDVKKK